MITTQVPQRQAAALRSPSRGFTVIELMIALLILAILMGAGIPLFTEATLGSRLNSYANNLVASVYLARSEAMKRNVVITLCTSTNGSTCAGSGGWEQGWIVRDATASVVLQNQAAVPPGFKLNAVDASSSALYTISFQPTGIGATQATFTVCKKTPDVGKQERVVTVSAQGKPTVSRTQAGACA